MQRVRRFLTGPTFLAAGTMVMHLGTFGFTVLSVTLLGPREYGALARMMATLMIVSVVQLGIQANAARRVATHPESAGLIAPVVMRVTWWSALALGLALAAASPVIGTILNIRAVPTALVLAAVTIPLTVSGGQCGILQGERRWRELSLIYIAHGLPRLVVGVLAMNVRPQALTAIVAVAVCQWIPVAIGWWMLHRRPPRLGEDAHADTEAHDAHAVRSFLVETAHNAQALLAFFALTNVDVIVAGKILDDQHAGLYAAGLVVTKIVMFLPQFVVVVAYPALSGGSARRALSAGLGLILVLGSLVALISWALSGLVVTGITLGDDQFVAIEQHLWAFALLGTALGMLQLLVYAVMAQREQRWSLLLWVAVIALVGVAATRDTVGGLLTVVGVVDTVLLVVLLVVASRAVFRPGVTAEQVAPPA